MHRTSRAAAVALVLVVCGHPVAATAQQAYTLQRGDTGPQVASWQRMLNMYLGAVRAPTPVVEDGIFGPATENATRRYERSSGGPTHVDGVVTTHDRILWLGGFLSMGWQGDPPLTAGLRDPRVGHLQVALNVWVARERLPVTPLWIDMVFGARTEALVRAFQARAGLTVDGIVGPRTWRALRDANLLRFPPAGFL